MTGSKALAVMWGKYKVADLTPGTNPNALDWQYTQEWIRKGFPIAPSLPLEGPIREEAVFAYLENLLPEGRALENLIRLHALSRNNVLALVLALGDDLAGALRILPSEEGYSAEPNSFRPIHTEEIVQRLEKPDILPMDIWDRRPRLSLAGMQTKLNVLEREPGLFGLCSGPDLASNTILKFESRQNLHLLLNEYLSLHLAAGLGHPVAQATLVRFGEHRTLHVRRFDRKFEGGHVKRRHMFDACQALGLPSTHKYERNFGDGRDVAHIRDGVSFEKVFALGQSMRSPSSFYSTLVDWMLFNVLIGNSDAHGKNLSFFGGMRGFTLTPWYDLVSVALLESVDETLAMSIGDVFDWRGIHALQCLEEVKATGLSQAFLEERLSHVLTSIEKTLPSLGKDLSDLDSEERSFVTRYKDFIAGRLTHWRAEEKVLAQFE